jgi:hypothetical protein
MAEIYEVHEYLTEQGRSPQRRDIATAKAYWNDYRRREDG